MTAALARCGRNHYRGHSGAAADRSGASAREGSLGASAQGLNVVVKLHAPTRHVDLFHFPSPTLSSSPPGSSV